MNAFMLFSKAHREDVKRLNPGISVVDIAKVLGSMWRGLSDEEKAAWKGSCSS